MGRNFLQDEIDRTLKIFTNKCTVINFNIFVSMTANWKLKMLISECTNYHIQMIATLVLMIS